ncbi:hypothetical protein CBR_g47070 [Chara braunii]|uniref:Integrase catalytic domain-containing protein n=1 Tax=Chara braunii TaxID=69332 RepID=A0A388M1E9_CHABU|nr:hypothetical protein CBR_g47070 [Chara braunii]|eukprot:GBG88371.1 hypothetical protein CBR_g47070 [Chara braunii]
MGEPHSRSTQQLQNDLTHNVKTLAAAVKVADSQLKQMDARIAALEARPSQAAPGCMTDTKKQLNGRIDHVVNLIGDLGAFTGPDTISSTVAAIKTDITKLQTRPGAATKNYKMRHFNISKFDDYNKTDALTWWQGFLTEASCRTVLAEDMLKALYLQLIGGAQAWMNHLAATKQCTIAELHTHITWKEFEQLWFTRFMVRNVVKAAMNEVYTSSQGSMPTRDWPSKWQKIVTTPGFDLSFPNQRSEFFSRSCVGLRSALGNEYDYASFQAIMDRANLVIQTDDKAANEKQSQPHYVAKQGYQRPTHNNAVISEETVDLHAAAASSGYGGVLAALPPKRPKRVRKNKATEATTSAGIGQQPWTTYKITKEVYDLRQRCSPYGAPVLFVRKKNKDLRLCIDYRKLNAQTVKNKDLRLCIDSLRPEEEQRSTVDDLLERLGGATYFSKLDLKSGHHQTEIQPQDRYKTAFKTRYGHFEWVVMPFGLTNAPAAFQAAMTTEFRDLLDRSVLIYLDDILVYSRMLDEHIVHLRVVLDRCDWPSTKRISTICHRNKGQSRVPFRELKPLSIPRAPRLSIAMDVTGPFPHDRLGHDGILTVVDRLSKYARFLLCKYHAAAPELTRLLHTGWITNQGVPEDIVSDRDTRFMSAFWTSLMAESGTTMKSSLARHPQTDGQTERAHQTAQMMLRTLIRPDQKDWVDRLPDIEFAYNTSVHPAICITPFELHHGGEKARIFADLLLPQAADIDVPCSPASVRKYRDLLIKARANMQKAQIRMQQQANRRRVPCPFREGDLVWVLSEEFVLEQDVSRKLLPKWFGPWEVTSVVGDDPAGPSFVVNIPSHLPVHRVFHASKLAIYTPPSTDEFPNRRSQDPPSMDGHQEVDRVITHRKYGNKPMQFKVTFKQCAPDDTRWISSADLQTSAPLIFADYEKRRVAKEAARGGDEAGMEQGRNRDGATRSGCGGGGDEVGMEKGRNRDGATRSGCEGGVQWSEWLEGRDGEGGNRDGEERGGSQNGKIVGVSGWGDGRGVGMRRGEITGRMARGKSGCGGEAGWRKGGIGMGRRDRNAREGSGGRDGRKLGMGRGGIEMVRRGEEVGTGIWSECRDGETVGGSGWGGALSPRLSTRRERSSRPTGSGQGGCATPPQLGKLSSAEGEATPPSTPPDSAALLAASCTSEENANVASSRYTYEDYAVHLVPPLDQPLHVQQSIACTVSSPSAADSAASPQSIARDSTSWSRLEELDPLTFTYFQWMPVPSTGRLSKPHCNVLMAQLRDYLHTAVPAPLMDAGAEVVDLHTYIAKIDHKFKAQRYDDIDAPLLYIRIQIGEATCSALIDCGASRNYINQDFMVRAGLGPRVRSKPQPTQVTLADGHTHKSIDRCIDNVPVYFAPHASEAVSFDILDTKFDMILGMSWL